MIERGGQQVADVRLGEEPRLVVIGAPVGSKQLHCYAAAGSDSCSYAAGFLSCVYKECILVQNA